MIKLSAIGIRVYIACIILLIYSPIVLMILLSFNTSGRISFPIEGFTTHWYVAPPSGYEYASYVSAAYTWPLWIALKNTLYVSLLTAILTMAIVTSIALALRHAIIGRDILFYVVLLGFLVPAVALGLGNLIMFRLLNWQLLWWTPAMLDTMYAVPFGLILMMARFEPDLMLYEGAARVTRASPFRVFLHVTLPLIKWEVLSSAIFGFVLAWGELIRTSFVMRGTGVISTYIAEQLSVNPVTPKWYAVGAIVTAISIIALFILGAVLSRSERKVTRE
jgi:putative spermidine/putrescine transport system permease protein